MMPCPWCGPWGGGMMGGWSAWWWGLIMMIFWLLILIGLVLLVVWAIRQIVHREGVPTGTSRALEIVQERYARGEISREQYEQMRRDLLGGASG